MSAPVLSHFIDGQWVSGPSTQPRLNPSDTREVVAHAPVGGAGEIDAAVRAARSAFGAWSDSSPELRSDILDRAGDQILARRQELGRLLAREEGKTLAEGVAETARAGRIFKYFAGEALRRHGRTLSSVRPGVEVRTDLEPIGVVGLVTPWNFPIAIPAWKAAPALAFGDTVVLKPAPQTPAVAAAMAQVLQDSGLPHGVFNLVLGDVDAGRALVAHPGVDAISFTGSQAAGALVAAEAARRRVRVQLEMGGKNPLVVLDDADLDRAVAVAVDGGYFSTGQRCTASSRLIVTDAIHDRFVGALVERLRQLTVGHALAEGVQMGPLVSDAQLQRSLGFVTAAERKGGTLLSGGRALKLDTPGHFMSPALIADDNPQSAINREEVFGPVVSLIRVRGFDDALEMANATELGLSAGVVTTSLSHAQRFRRSVRAGMVMVNLPTAGVDYHVPFGGTRGSSLGPREQGFAAVEFYTQTKTSYVMA